MDYGKRILEDRSKKTCLEIARFIGDDEGRFAGLVDAFFNAEGNEQNWLMWVISHTVERNPRLVMAHLDKFVHHLDPGHSGAVNRGIVRMLRDTRVLPEELAGEIYTKCFDLLQDSGQAIAVRAFSIKVLARIACHHPELKTELIPLLYDLYTYSEKALFVSARDALRELGEKV